jgi:hypothetical protein
VACRNPELAKKRAHTRQSLLEATVALLEPIRQLVTAARLKGQDRIGLCVGKVLNRYKVGKHLDLVIGDASAVHAGAVLQRPVRDFAHCAGRAPGRRDRIALRFGRLFFVGEQQRALGMHHVPLDVKGEHAQQQVGTHPVGQPVIGSLPAPPVRR